MNDHKGPGKPDDSVPRDAAGETYWDRVRNINAQMDDLQGIFLGVLAEEQAHEFVDTPEPAPVDITVPPKVRIPLEIGFSGLDTLVDAWVHLVDHNCPQARSLIERFFAGLLVELSEEAQKLGWTHKQDNGLWIPEEGEE